MNLSSENSRLQLMKDLKSELKKLYGEDDYNVFCFGSFLTKNFVEGKSDIDLAVYCEDKMKLIQIECTIEDFLQEKVPELSIHLLTIELTSYKFVNSDILIKGVQFTDYFPDYMKVYLYRLRQELRHHNERIEHRRFIILANKQFENVTLPQN